MKKLVVGLIIALVAIIILIISLYFYFLAPVAKNDSKNISFVVKQGEGEKQIIDNLKTADLIRCKEAAYIYNLFHRDYTFKVGTFTLKRNMSVKQIFKTLDSGKTKEQKGINITFKEGKRYPDYLEEISSSLKISEDDFKNLMQDNNYLKSLIADYWFLTDDILNPDIYYPLEGYLFPDTYNFFENTSAQDVLKTILDNTESKLAPYKKDMQKNAYSIHEIMTLASIVELEGKDGSDRAGIVGVFTNRINIGMSLGSDVTTYYAVQKEFKDNLTADELSECNAYNTRGTCFKGLPVGPISNPGIEAIKAAIYPEDNDYLFFVSDKSGKIYFSKTNAEHEQQVAKLKDNGNWYVYE